MSDSSWYVYIVKCCDQSLYTGIAKDVNRRLEEHNAGPKGAKYTRARRPVTLAYQEQSENRASACRRESEIKKLTRTQKLALIDRGV